MHEKIRRQVSEACNRLYSLGLCDKLRGSVSAYDRKCGVILIKPAEPSCGEITPIDVLAVTDDGLKIDGDGNLPEEIATHIEIYKSLPQVDSIAVANPLFATVFAQAGKPIKPYGTTHAEYFGDLIPCTRKLTPSEIEEEYQKKLGRLIVETITEDDDMTKEVGAVLVSSDGVFCFDSSPSLTVDRMEAVERVARLAFYTELLMRVGQTGGTRMQEDLLRYCYERDHSVE